MVGNILKATVSTGTVFLRTNPAFGVLMGIADITGFSDYVFNGVDRVIYNK